LSQGFTLEVIYVDGRVDEFQCTDETTTVGASAEATIPLDLDELSPKHLLVMPREHGCWVSVARGVKTPVLLAGIPVDNQEVPWGSELDIGTVTLRLKEAEAVVNARAESQRSLIRILGLAALALMAFYFLQDTKTLAPSPPATAPELFDGKAIECSIETTTLQQRGRDLNAAGTAYWHRYPFDPQEGVRASRLFLEAENCFSGAGMQALADKMQQQKNEIVDTMNRDYQSMRLQLSRALEHGDDGLAAELVGDLARFIQHRPGDYYDWLGRVDRYLQNKNG
jgi:hypothetical protein